MPTVSAKVSKKELDAIQEYTNACGETISNLIRKTVIRSATFMEWENDSKEYEFGISLPENISGDEETHILEETYNKIRHILDLKSIKI